ncbi:MAG: DUF86 domain-containing protein [Chitinophagales bacterium]|nr:DUF86 domain-containing protein [Bacteroidota bacterium]
MDDVLIYKAQTIERCINRVQEMYAVSKEEIDTNFLYQDAIILNIERACQAAIDMGSHFVKTHKLGIPQSSKDVFQILHSNKIIDESLNLKLQAMVGFRKIAVHDYSNLNLEILHSIIQKDIDDILTFSKTILLK